MPPRGMAQDRSVPPRQVLAHTVPGHMVRRGHTEQVLTVMVAMVPAVPVGRADSSLRSRGNPIPPELVRTRISPVPVADPLPQTFTRLLTPL